jgi:release factor glutamine methyltransferase
MFEHVTPEETFDCILSNPPYIASGELDALMEEVRDHDPRLALDGGEDGLCFYRILAKEAGKYLKEQGHLFLEIGYDQGAAVSGLLWEAGYDNVRVIRDLCGNDRVVCAIKGR